MEYVLTDWSGAVIVQYWVNFCLCDICYSEMLNIKRHSTRNIVMAITVTIVSGAVLLLIAIAQAEKAIALKATREQMSLLVMEILYIWTIIPGCSEVDLRQMLEGVCRLSLTSRSSGPVRSLFNIG